MKKLFLLMLIALSVQAQTQSEHIRLVSNNVDIVARHCQDYLQRYKLGVPKAYDLCRHDPSTIFYHEVDHNLRTNVGTDAQATQMGSTSQAAACNYIALSNDTGAPAATDTVLAGEITTNGLGRAQGTYAHTNGTAVYTIAHTFYPSGTQQSQKSALLNAGTSGTMCFENTYTPVTVGSGDTLAITWSINY